MDLKSLRKKKGLTQNEAAEIVGLSRRGYQNLEMGSYKKAASKTMDYCLARLEALPNKRKEGALSSISITRALEDVLYGESVEYVYANKENRKEGVLYQFVLACELDDFDLLSLEEELGARLRAAVSFQKMDSLLENKEKSLEFFKKARRIYPR